MDPYRHNRSDAVFDDGDYFNFVSNAEPSNSTPGHNGIMFTIDSKSEKHSPSRVIEKPEFMASGTGIRCSAYRNSNKSKIQKDTTLSESESLLKNFTEQVLVPPTPVPPPDPIIPSSKPKSRRELQIHANTTPVDVDLVKSDGLIPSKFEAQVDSPILIETQESPRREEFGNVMKFDKNRDFGKHRFVPRLFGIETIRE